MQEEIADQPTIPTYTKNVTPLIPKKIGPYKIESLLKKGGMSFLYLGVDPISAKPIVIKVLSPKFIKSEDAIKRFLKEADIIRISNHPNIVKLFGQGTWDHGLYIAMEFVQGISLKQFLLTKSLSMHKALEIILQVAYALCHLHTHGIIHRDLKPENILITENGQIKVIDFGIANLIDEKDQDFKGGFIGTPIYMSPEQKKKPENVTFASDIYALAVITYELILGKLSHGTIHLSLIPKNFKKILEKALQEDPKKRYTDIVDFITDISEYMKSRDTLENKKAEDNYDEIYTSLINTDKLFFKQDMPSWKSLEIATEVDKTISEMGLYVDFYQLSANIFSVILAKSEKNDLESFIHTSIFRGYIKMALSTAKEKKDFSPANILNEINLAVSEDNLEENFFINLFVINLKDDGILYSASLEADNYLMDTAAHKCTIITNNNHKMTGDKTQEFVETNLNFKSSDEIILLSTKIKSEKQDAIKKQIAENILFSAHNQVEKIIINFKNFIIKEGKNTFAAICVRRKI